MKRGLYRIRGVGDLPNDARVDDDGIEVPLEEDLYRKRGYLPPFELLPWSDEYLSLRQSAEGVVLPHRRMLPNDRLIASSLMLPLPHRLGLVSVCLVTRLFVVTVPVELWATR
jgi:hypothetical protein